MSKHIMSYFPGVPRPIQKKVLTEIEDSWDVTDVYVVNVPVGGGKSRIAMTLGKWNFTTDILTPTNLLVQQYVKDFPEYPKLFKASLYKCCRDAKYRKHPSCQRASDMRKVMGTKRGIMNLYMYMSLLTNKRRTPGNVLVIDEAHNLLPTMQDLMAIKLWRHDYHWPDSISTREELYRWAKGQLSITENKENKVLGMIVDQCESPTPTYVFERSREWWYKTKEPQLRDLITMKPLDVSGGPSYFWGSHVQKLVLMSATINRKDIEAMGLNNRRVKYLECGSPIPKRNRPVVIDPVMTIAKTNLHVASEKIVDQILLKYIPKHRGQKGIIHATYEMAELIKKKVPAKDLDLFIFHDKNNKASQFKKFLQSSSDSGKILVASGMYEGIDLPGDLGRWQIIAKVPWPSLGDKAILYKATTDPQWYAWQTLKDLIQASGRVCRGPEDYGITYILDGSFKKLYGDSVDIPHWFDEALIWEAENE